MPHGQPPGNPLSPALRSDQWLFQRPPAESKFLVATGPDPMYVQASLFSDNASAPGSSLGAFNYYGSPLMFSHQTPNFYGNFNVTANTKYWIQITTSGVYATNSNYVRTTNDTSESGLAGWSIADSSRLQYAEAGPSIKMEIGGLAAMSRVRRKAV